MAYFYPLKVRTISIIKNSCSKISTKNCPRSRRLETNSGCKKIIPKSRSKGNSRKFSNTINSVQFSSRISNTPISKNITYKQQHSSEKVPPIISISQIFSNFGN